MATWPANGSNIDTWDAALLAWLMDKVFAVDGTFKDNFIIDTSFSIADACDIAVNTTTGTKIGTATGQKLGFFNATPVVQAANTSDLKDMLVALGFIATGGATPLDLDGGKLTSGDVWPAADDTYYLGKNDDDTPFAWKGLILKDQGGTGKYYRLEVFGDALRIVDLTD